MSAPHKHAAIIKAWADGVEIECRQATDNGFTPWGRITTPDRPSWDATEYRVKPEPAKYPETRMTFDDCLDAWGAPELKWHARTKQIANAAIKHAIDHNYCAPPIDLFAFSDEFVKKRDERDMAIAKAVEAHIAKTLRETTGWHIVDCGLPAIIASVKD